MNNDDGLRKLVDPIFAAEALMVDPARANYEVIKARIAKQFGTAEVNKWVLESTPIPPGFLEEAIKAGFTTIPPSLEVKKYE